MMFATNSMSRFRINRLRWNRPESNGRRWERIVTPTIKAVAESLERRMLLSATASMVADINTTTTDAHVACLADLGNGKVVFFANDGVHGEEPYVSDGTAAGTMMLKDINPGPGDSPLPIVNPTANHTYYPGVVANGRFFFAATDGVDGYELWSTDGTPGGTTLVKDINPGSASSVSPQLVVVGNTIFFVANDGTDGSQLWETDGTAAGTLMLTSIGTSPKGGNPHIGPVFDGRLFFSANDGVDGGELWSTDGTLAGTSMVTTIGTSTNTLGLDLVFNGRLYFTTDDGVHGNELWSTDGTAAGTAMLMDINPGSASSYPSALTICGSQLFFTANDGTHGSELWVTDGTSAGTHLVSDLAPGSLPSALGGMTDVNGTLLFADSSGQSSALYKTDGTSAGTVMIRSFNSIRSMIEYSGREYFIGNDGISGYELWQSDGTTAGTTQVADLAPGAASAFINGMGALTVAGSNLFFAADAGEGEQLYVITSVGAAPTAISPPGAIQLITFQDFLPVGSSLYFTGPSLAAEGQLWHSDGTAAGTGMVADITTMTIGSNPSELTEINGRGIFAADDTIHGTELWVTDGSAGGTTLLKDIVPGAADGLAPDLYGPEFKPVRLGNYYYFAAGVGNGQIWRTDGTSNGTTLCLSFMPSSPYTGYAGVSQLTSINGSLYFFADDGTGSALYISDGTPSGTTRLQYLSSPTNNGDVVYGSQFSMVGNEVIFAATDSVHGTEPWVTDGTPAGTKLLMDIDPGTASSLPHYFDAPQRFVDVGWFAYFTVQVQGGMALWRTDGTSAGTSIVEDFSTNATVSGVDDLTYFNAKLYFVTTPRSGSGGALWTNDGTGSGTQLFESFSITPADLTVLGDRLLFSAAPSAGGSGRQLFASDGTVAGTFLVPVDGTVQGGFSPNDLTNAQGTLYFTALDQAGAEGLWRVDRSIIQDGVAIENVWLFPPSVVNPNPTNLAGLDGTLFFRETDQAHGAELWKLNLLYASAGGPYLATGSTVQLNASASRDPNPSYPLTYSWDLNGNGIFGETGSAASNGNETGVNPIFDANQSYPGVYPVTVQVAGSWQNTATSTSYVAVAPLPHFAGDSLTFTLGSAVANASIQSWSINWGDGTPVENYAGSTTSVSHIFANASGANPFMVQVSAVGASGSVQPLPMPVTVYPDPVLNNGLLSLMGTGGNDALAVGNASGEFFLNLNGAIRQYNSSMISHFVYNDGGGNDQISLRDSFLATLNLSTGNDSITNSGATAIINPGTGKISVNVSSGGSTTFAASGGSGIRQVQLSSMTVSANAKVVFATSSATLGDYSNHANRNVAVIDAGGLNIASGGTLDLGDNDLILNYDPANESITRNLIAGLITSGYGTNKNFSGTGLTSSEANYDATQSGGTRVLGWADNADLGKTSFDGVTLSSPNEMLVKFTYYGDCNLDGIVDTGPDLSLFAKGFHAQGSGWDFGDFNYDGLTNNLDLSLYARGLNSGYKMYGAL